MDSAATPHKTDDPALIDEAVGFAYRQNGRIYRRVDDFR